MLISFIARGAPIGNGYFALGTLVALLLALVMLIGGWYWVTGPTDLERQQRALEQANPTECSLFRDRTGEQQSDGTKNSDNS